MSVSDGERQASEYDIRQVHLCGVLPTCARLHQSPTPFMRYFTGFLISGCILFLSVWTTGCNDTVIDPFENDGQYFTVYGFLDILEPDHSLRVIPVTRTPERILSPTDPGATIDAEVFTTDLFNGNRVRWTHALEKLDDGTYGHVFRSRFIVKARHPYELEVVRKDGKRTMAVTTIPAIGDAARFEKGPEVFSEDSTVLYQDLVIPGVSSPWQMQAIYGWGGGLINRRVFVQYGRAGERTGNGDWKVRLEISRDQEIVRDNIQWSIENQSDRITAATLVGLTSVGLQIRILDDNWDPPGGIFDLETQAVPGTLSNVENGYGFWGSVGLYVQEWNAVHLSVPLGYDF